MKKKYRHLDNSNPVMDISSLIDVCFLLLIYFVVTSTIAEPESDLILQLPDPQGKEKNLIDTAHFYIDEKGIISQIADDNTETPLTTKGNADYSARRPNSMPVLAQIIKSYHHFAGDEASILLKTAPEVPAQYVIDLLNLLSSEGISKIGFMKNTLN